LLLQPYLNYFYKTEKVTSVQFLNIKNKYWKDRIMKARLLKMKLSIIIIFLQNYEGDEHETGETSRIQVTGRIIKLGKAC